MCPIKVRREKVAVQKHVAVAVALFPDSALNSWKPHLYKSFYLTLLRASPDGVTDSKSSAVLG